MLEHLAKMDVLRLKSVGQGSVWEGASLLVDRSHSRPRIEGLTLRLGPCPPPLSQATSTRQRSRTTLTTCTLGSRPTARSSTTWSASRPKTTGRAPTVRRARAPAVCRLSLRIASSSHGSLTLTLPLLRPTCRARPQAALADGREGPAARDARGAAHH